jgi:hypothetical protein
VIRVVVRQSRIGARSDSGQPQQRAHGRRHGAAGSGAVWNEPSSSGRSRQGELVRYFHAVASSVRR